MTTTYILTAENRSELLKLFEAPRIGIMAPLDQDGNPDLCERWAKPFISRNIDVFMLPVGTPNPQEILEHVDGLMLPGGDTNIHPFFYTGIYAEFDDDDIARDQYAFDLIKMAYDMDLPTLGVCRGFQEMIVAHGAPIRQLKDTTYQHWLGYEGRREDGNHCFITMDRPVHPFVIEEGGLLSEIYNQSAIENYGIKLDENGHIMVNSLHYEGMDEYMWGLPQSAEFRTRFRAEAWSPDEPKRVLEAISAIGKRFFVGYQPHIELEGAQHKALFDTPQIGLIDNILAYQAERIQAHTIQKDRDSCQPEA